MSIHRFVLPAVLLALVGCPSTGPAPQGPSTQAHLAVAHLPPLASEQGHYALWTVTDATMSYGMMFQVNDQGQMTIRDGMVWGGNATLPVARTSIKGFVVTQEPPITGLTTPSKQVLLAGSVANDRATLALAAPFEPGTLEAATGSYVLDNPSTESLGDMNGVCFMNERRTGGGLQLPFPPPEDWGYETWIELEGHMLPLGKFVDPDGSDDWNGYSGHTPPFPGEDFDVNLPAGLETGFNRPDLRGAKLIVSVEGRSLNREEVYPSAIRVFEATIPLDAEHYKGYPMRNVAADGLPTGTVTLRE